VEIRLEQKRFVKEKTMQNTDKSPVLEKLIEAGQIKSYEIGICMTEITFPNGNVMTVASTRTGDLRFYFNEK
jgi:hypothetical protein